MRIYLRIKKRLDDKKQFDNESADPLLLQKKQSSSFRAGDARNRALPEGEGRNAKTIFNLGRVK
jgi:hypothetical protein